MNQRMGKECGKVPSSFRETFLKKDSLVSRLIKFKKHFAYH